MNIVKIATDYLVVGAGAASLAFVDTLLTEQPNATVVLVDKHPAPGGHWNDAYGFVHLHQPSLLYGVASRQLEGNWLKLLARGMLPWQHRASKSEILAYYQKVVDSWVHQGRVQYFPSCVYDFAHINANPKEDIHKLDALDGSKSYRVTVNVKLVNGILGECKVPSQCAVAFPVDKEVCLVTPNQIHDEHDQRVQSLKKKFFWRRGQVRNNSRQQQQQKYVVLGGGKTGMDTVVFLQRDMGVLPDHIHWVVPNDVWMLSRDSGSPYAWAKALVENELNADKAALQLEQEGMFVRLDKNVLPTRFRFPIIGRDELEYLQKVKKNTIRRGRVTSISAIQQDSADCIQVEFDGAKQEPWIVDKDTCFVHCTSPGPFNGNDSTQIFVSDKSMNLSFLFAPPVPISMSCLAKLESARRLGTLDVDFGRRLIQASRRNTNDSMTDNDVLHQLFTGYDVAAGPQGQIKPLILSALCLSLMYKDPMKSFQWMKNNRLSFFSVPTFKSGVYEDVLTLSSKYSALGYTENDASMFSLLAEKLTPLQGK